MNRILPEASWPPSWRYSYAYDLQEIYGEVHNPGYVYAYQNRRNLTLQLIEEVLPEGSSILDVAGAQGNFTLTLAERGYRVTWNDLRQELEGYVRKKYERGDVSFAPGNIFDQSFESAFDCVLITEIIEHVAHPDQFLRKIASMIRRGGYIVMTTPNGAYIRNTLPRFSECSNPDLYENVQFKPDADGHIFLLRPDEVRLLAEECNLEIDEQIFFTTFLTAGYLKTARMLRILPRSAVFALESVIAHLSDVVRERLMVHTAVRLRKPTWPLGEAAPPEQLTDTMVQLPRGTTSRAHPSTASVGQAAPACAPAERLRTSTSRPM